MGKQLSMTLRFDISNDLDKAITDVEMFAFLGFDLHKVSRWGGHSKPRRDCQCFSISLPLQASLAVQLMATLNAVMGDEGTSRTIRKQCDTLRTNLTTAMGLPAESHATAKDFAFMDAILECPHEPVNWMAYADWLSEQDNPIDRKRGELIVGWLGDKAMKVYNGTEPALVRDIKRMRRFVA